MMKRLHLILMIFLLAAGTSVMAQTVTSDKDDYAPGEVAIITGSGWLNDQYVNVRFDEDPDYEHEHFYENVPVNSDGTWTLEYQIEERHLGVHFYVTATGQLSGQIATTVFTDANLQNIPSFNSTLSQQLY